MEKNEIDIFSGYQYRRASTDIAELIKKAILSDKFQEGDRLPPERDLATQFQVGRMTIREALRTLETKGLIAIRKGSNGGAFVQPAPPDQIAEIIVDNLQLDGITLKDVAESRIVLEGNIAKYAIENATEEDLEAIHQNIEASKSLVSDFSPEGAREFTAKSIEFHHLIVIAAHITPLIVFHSVLAKWTARSTSFYFRLTEEDRHYSNQNHENIYNAIRNKDVALCQKLVEEHILTIIEKVEKAVEAEKD